MSVEIILSAKQLQLDINNQAVLNLKATFSRVPPNTSALYKIRTNSHNLMDVRPSFGILRANSEDASIASLKIKYTGSLDQISKMKVQVSWVYGQNVPQRKLGHTEFNQFYKAFKEKLNKEKNQMVQFTSQHLLKLSQSSIDSHQKSSASSANESEREQAALKQQQQPIVQSDINSSSNNRKISFKVLFVAVVIAFVLGILAGLKLEAFLENNSSGNRFEDITSIFRGKKNSSDIGVAIEASQEQASGELFDQVAQQLVKVSKQFQDL